MEYAQRTGHNEELPAVYNYLFNRDLSHDLINSCHRLRRFGNPRNLEQVQRKMKNSIVNLSKNKRMRTRALMKKRKKRKVPKMKTLGNTGMRVKRMWRSRKFLTWIPPMQRIISKLSLSRTSLRLRHRWRMR